MNKWAALVQEWLGESVDLMRAGWMPMRLCCSSMPVWAGASLDRHRRLPPDKGKPPLPYWNLGWKRWTWWDLILKICLRDLKKLDCQSYALMLSFSWRSSDRSEKCLKKGAWDDHHIVNSDLFMPVVVLQILFMLSQYQNAMHLCPVHHIAYHAPILVSIRCHCFSPVLLRYIYDTELLQKTTPDPRYKLIFQSETNSP